jgi:hypothetical protein
MLLVDLQTTYAVVIDSKVCVPLKPSVRQTVVYSWCHYVFSHHHHHSSDWNSHPGM